MKHINLMAVILLTMFSGGVNAQYFVMTDSLSSPRLNHQSQKLNDGRVITFGGEDGTFNLNNTYATAQIYSNGVWTNTGSMHCPRTQFSSVVLGNGKVLAIGGVADQLNYEWASCELYDPATGQWTYTDSLASATYIAGAVVLQSGKVLLADGDSSHIYDPATGHWGSVVAMAAPHGAGPAVALLQNGKVLAVGGSDNNMVADVYDPATNTWTATANNTHYSRYLTSAITLNNGEVLVFGSAAIDSGQNTSELYNPATNSFTVTGNLVTNVSSSPAVLLDNGNPILWGLGNEFGLPTQVIQVYNVATGTWSSPPSNILGTNNNTLVKMANNKVLAIAGEELGAALPYCWLIDGASLTGVGELMPAAQFAVWPNPGTDYLQLNTAQLPGLQTIHICDMQGRTLLQLAANGSEAFSTGALASGPYLISAFNAEGHLVGLSRWVKM
jgi:Kelch motif